MDSGRDSRRLRLRWIALFTLVSLLISASISFADDESRDATEPAALSAPPSDPQGLELKSERTATSQTFRLPNGMRETRIFEHAINYRDESGDWKPIDESIQQQGDILVDDENRFDVNFPERMGAEPVRLTVGDQWVSYQLLGPQSREAKLEGGTATYEALSSGTSFYLTNIANGVKENIEIADASQPHSFSFDLDASDGLTPAMGADGSVEFKTTTISWSPFSRPRLSQTAHHRQKLRAPRSISASSPRAATTGAWRSKPIRAG